MNESKIPPSCPHSERALLGAMLRYNDWIADVVAILRQEHFYTYASQCIYAAIVDRWNDGKPTDTVLLVEELLRRGQLDDVGGAWSIDKLLDEAATHVEWHAREVKATAIKRGVLHAAIEIARDAYDPGCQANDLLEGAEKKIFAVAEMGVEGQSVPLAQAVDEATKRIDARLSGDEKPGVLSGLIDLDNRMGGFRKGELTVVGARLSVGKTSFALTCALRAASTGTPVLFVSLEQSRQELVERLLCMQAEIDSHRLRDGSLSPQDQELMPPAADILRRLPFHIDDTPGQGIVRIAANARRCRRKHGIGLVVIDYLQLIEPEDRRVNRQEQVTCISHRTKTLARELAVPVVALCQLNREPENRQGGRPKVSDLRESDAIGQDADVVLLLWKPEGDSEGPIDKVEVVVGKNRNGRTGSVPLHFRKANMRFESMAVDVPFGVMG
jgi:replicative DNA helicase